MSAAPPPPPPPPYPSATSARTNAAWDRRALKQQRRAAKLQFRQQVTLQRAQLRASRRTSILGPALLLGLGTVFLLAELGHIQPDAAVAWLGRWWPLVLVGAGFILLLEWGVDTWIATQRGTAALPRRVGGGTSLLLVLLVLVGAALLAVQNRPDWLARNLTPEFADSVGLDQVFAPHREIQRDLAAPLPAKGLLTVQNFRGNITVRGDSQDGQVHVTARQRISAWQRSELQAREDRERPSLQSTASGLLLDVEGDTRDRTDLTIEVPHDTALVIQPEQGELNVAELRGPLTVNSHIGNVTLAALTGPAHLTINDENATVSAHSLTGETVISGQTGDLSLSDINGPLTLRGDFFGTTHLERVTGAVHFQSSFTELACLGIPGELNVEGRNDLDATNLDGPVTLRTTDRNLTLSDIRHGVTIENSSGSVTLSLAEPVGPVKVVTTDGAIDLRVPDRAAFALNAETRNGQIANDLGLTSRSEDGRALVSAKIREGGPQVSLTTTEADIRIHKGAAVLTEDDRSGATKAKPSTDSDESQD